MHPSAMMIRLCALTLLMLAAINAPCLDAARADHNPDVLAIAPDLVNPTIASGAPAPGKMVLQSLPAYAKTKVAHALYLPADWSPGKRFPVLIEYHGNGRRVRDGGGLGYGISGGKGFIWAVLPYVSPDHKSDMDRWWGDVEATVAYAKAAVPAICRQWGGDPARVILVGHSRGAIACNFIGLHDGEIARLWRAMIAVSHYDDGHVLWGMTPEEQQRAAERLARLGPIPQFICGEHHLSRNHNDKKLVELVNAGKYASFAKAEQELGLAPMFDQEGTRKFITTHAPLARCTFVALPYINHTPDYVLRDIPERRQLRAWVQEVLQ